jgi:hypothetical protein
MPKRRVRIVLDDIFKLGMRPGTRMVSNTFSMGGWEPDQVIRVSSNSGYFWRVPA